MAFTNSPQVNSHKTDYVPFGIKQPFRTPQQIVSFGINQEAINTPRTLNFIRETDGQKSWLRTRPGLSIGTNPGYDPGNVTRTKVYSDRNGNSRLIVLESNNVRLDGAVICTGQGANTHFDVFKYLNGQETIVITDGGFSSPKLYNITTSTLTTITDPDFPATGNYPVVIDNYVFVATSNNDIYQCDFNNPASWTPGGFITADLTPGNIFYMGRTNNYLTVFKTGGVEFLYNAGNTTGSVLAQYETFFKNINIFRYQLPVLFNDSWFFLGSGNNSKQGLYSLNTSSMEVILDLASFQYSLPQPSSATNYLFFFELAGKVFLQIPTLANNNSTFMIFLDLLEKDIVYFDFGNAGTFAGFTSTYFIDGVWYFNMSGQSTILEYRLNTVPLFQDYGQNIRYELYTGKIDHDTTYLKTCSRLLFDLEPYNNTGNPTVSVQWATRDATTLSTARTTKPFTYSGNESNQSSRSSLILNRLGKYRQRFYKFIFFGASFKLNGAWFDLDVGTN